MTLDGSDTIFKVGAQTYMLRVWDKFECNVFGRSPIPGMTIDAEVEVRDAKPPFGPSEAFSKASELFRNFLAGTEEAVFAPASEMDVAGFEKDQVRVLTKELDADGSEVAVVHTAKGKWLLKHEPSLLGVYWLG